MVGFDEEGLVDPWVVKVMGGRGQQAQEDVTGCQRLGELHRGNVHRASAQRSKLLCVHLSAIFL